MEWNGMEGWKKWNQWNEETGMDQSGMETTWIN